MVFSLGVPKARADFFGGDLVILAEILANAVQQLTQLQSILGTGQDSYRYLQEINEGLKSALRIMRTANRTLQPGVLSDMDSLDKVLDAVSDIYGAIPRTSEARLQGMTDKSVAESVHLHNEAFRYADQIDPEAERIKSHAQNVSPLGAGRLTAESLGVLIHVLNQVLRTNAALLKVQSEQLALMNRKEKLGSAQFKAQYDGIAQAFEKLRPEYKLPSLKH